MSIGEYDHLNGDPGDGVTIQIDDIARQIVRLNHGTHRLLSAIVRERRNYAKQRGLQSPDDFADRIEKMLNDGKS